MVNRIFERGTFFPTTTLNEMIITLLIMYLFKIWQMQKIEQVMLEVTVTLLALENLQLVFKKTIHCKIYDIVMIRLGFTCHVFLGLLPLEGDYRAWSLYSQNDLGMI